MASLAGERNKGLQRFEPVLFLLLLAVHLSVLFRYEWYPTLDGPAHLYNAHLIKQLVLGNEFLARFLVFSDFPEPNWSGHAIMALLGVVLPANLVEKGLVFLIFAGTALSFRWLVLRLNDGPIPGTLLIFPFLCSYTFRIGFFNFSLSVVFLLLVLVFWHRNRTTPTPLRTLILSLLLGLVYFSNALTTLICIGMIALWTGLEQLPASRPSGWQRPLLSVLVASAPWLALILLFLLRGSGEAITAFLSAEQLWSMVRDGITFTFQTGPLMVIAARVVALCLISLVAILLFIRSRGNRNFLTSDLWLLMAVLSLAGYMIMPDRAATGGIISVRFLLFFYLFLATWLALQKHWPLPARVILIPYLFADLVLVYADHRFTGMLNDDVVEIRSALPFVEDEGIILPLLYTDNWLLSNFSNYLGTGRGILVFDNYEAMSPHFPLRWRTEHRAPPMPQGFLNSNRPCLDIDALGDSVHLRFDYVLRWEYHPDLWDSCTAHITRQLHQDFTLKYRSAAGRVELHNRD